MPCSSTVQPTCNRPSLRRCSMPRFLTMTTLSCLIAILAQPAPASPTRGKILAHPVPKPNLAQVYAKGTTDGIVFKSQTFLNLYCHDMASVGRTLSLQTYLD